MPEISWLADLTNASGFALFAFVVFVAAIAIWRGWVVPGWLYREKVDELKLTKVELAKQVAINEALTAGFRNEPRRRHSDNAAP